MPRYSSKTHLVPRSLCEHASKEGVHVTGVHGCAVLLDALHIAEDEGLQLKGLLNASQRQIASAGTCRQARAPSGDPMGSAPGTSCRLAPATGSLHVCTSSAAWQGTHLTHVDKLPALTSPHSAAHKH